MKDFLMRFYFLDLESMTKLFVTLAHRKSEPFSSRNTGWYLARPTIIERTM